jgi:hypothetical protein
MASKSIVLRALKIELCRFHVSDCKGISTNSHVELFFLLHSTGRHQVRVDEMDTNCEHSTWALAKADKALAEGTVLPQCKKLIL